MYIFLKLNKIIITIIINKKIIIIIIIIKKLLLLLLRVMSQMKYIYIEQNWRHHKVRHCVNKIMLKC